jgi:parallel beta-helix repeat protein
MSSSIQSSAATRLRPFAVAALSLATIGVLAAGSGQARAAQVHCGDRITQDTKLTKDLKNCPNKGLVIAADNVTLDLNGHTIDGNNKLVDQCPAACDLGVWVRGKHGVTIKGGRITQFGFGLFLLNDNRNRVRDVASLRNHFNGLLLVSSKSDRVIESRTNFNGLDVDYPGVALIDSKRLRMRDNTSSHNADLGFFIQGTDRSRFVRNNLNHNPELGAIIDGNQNVIRRNRGGMALTGNGNRVKRNLVDARGCSDQCGTGISLESGHDNLIAGNKVRDTPAAGIRLKTFVKSSALADNVVRRNHVDGAGGRGIAIADGVRRTLLLANHVDRSENAGIRVASASSVASENHANHNGRLGISAVRGVIDGGGNIARGNGDPRECNHVTCG